MNLRAAPKAEQSARKRTEPSEGNVNSIETPAPQSEAWIFGDNLFYVLLIGLFVVSLYPFLIAPSLVLTVVLSLPPFVLIWFYARSKRQYIRRAIENESNCLTTFVTNADALWRTLKSKSTAAISEQDVLGLVPDAVRKPSVHAKSLIEDIAKGKMYLLDASRDFIVRPYRDKLEGQYRDAAYCASLSTKVGILGTFFGFIVALAHLSLFFGSLSETDLSSQTAPNLAAFTELIGSTLQNLAYAFVKSVYGLTFAILIAGGISNLREPIDKSYRLFDDAFGFGREFVNRLTLADPTIHSSLFEVRNALQNLHQRLFDHSNTIAHALREHGQLINEQSAVFTSAAQGMVNVQEKWDGAFKRLEDAGATFEQRTAGTFDKIERGFSTVGASVGDLLKSFEIARSNFSQTSETALGSIKLSEENWSKRFDALITRTNDQEKKFGQWAGIVDNAFGAFQRQIGTLEDNLKSIYSGHETNTSASRELTVAIDRLNKTLRSPARRDDFFALISNRGTKVVLFLMAASAVVILADIYIFDDPLTLKSLFRPNGRRSY